MQCNSVLNVSKSDQGHLQPHCSHGNGLPDHGLVCMLTLLDQSKGRFFLIPIDAHSKWMEVHPMSSTTATATVVRLRSIYAQFGLPETLVFDSGPQFVAEEFHSFCKNNAINHVQVAPYHPSSNGLAERAAQTFKHSFRKTDGTLSECLAEWLFSYRITPQTTTGKAPVELLFGRQLRSWLDHI